MNTDEIMVKWNGTLAHVILIQVYFLVKLYSQVFT